MTTPLTPEERTQQSLESIRTHINNTLKGYVEDIELKHTQVDSIKATIDSYLEEFEGQAQAIKDGTSALAVEVQRVDEFSERIDSKANTSHTHVSTDIVDSISTLTLGQGNKVVRTDESGAVLQGFAPTLPNHLTTKAHVDTELSKKANSVHSHIVGNISGLQSSLDSKVDSGDVTATADSTTYGKIPRRETNSNNILVGGAPTLPNHATSKTYVDGVKTTLEGLIGGKANATHTHTQSEITDLPTPNTSAVAGTLVVRDSEGKISVNSPTTANHAATKEYVDSQVSSKANTSHTHVQADITDLPTSNTGAVANTLAVRGTGGVLTVGTPTATTHATTKDYVDSALGGKANSSHTHTSSQISDATATGRSVLTASSQAAARSAIGAGTSSLALGTTASTAAAGNHTHSQYATTAQVEARTPEIREVASPDQATSPGVLYVVKEG